ncbi:hypothetical protein F4825DRAFT_192071 [Nemania diffusa]|nr:hypothetical protein F4825DRAFT_192071 [Nemania diffusa]
MCSFFLITISLYYILQIKVLSMTSFNTALYKDFHHMGFNARGFSCIILKYGNWGYLHQCLVLSPCLIILFSFS